MIKYLIFFVFLGICLSSGANAMCAVIIGDKCYEAPEGTFDMSFDNSEGKVYINGKEVRLNTGKENAPTQVTVVVNGNVNSIQKAYKVEVTGDAGDVQTVSGNVSIGKNVKGSVRTVSGDVTAQSIDGPINTVSGNVNKR